MTRILSTLEQHAPIEGKENFVAQEKPKRQSGTGSIIVEKNGLAIRWPVYFLNEAGLKKRKMKYEFLGSVSEREASGRLIDRLAEVRKEGVKPPPPKPLTFSEHVERWQVNMLNSAGADAADHYKFSVRDNRAGVIKAQLIPFFGNFALSEISTLHVQDWIATLRQKNLLPSTIHSYVKVLRVVLQAAVRWKLVSENAAKEAELPKIRKREIEKKKWAYDAKEAARLVAQIKTKKVRAMVALAITAGPRRGELIAARWKHLDEVASKLSVVEASYRGHISTPKTEAGIRDLPLDPWTLDLLKEWKRLSKHTRPDDFIFSTRTGQQESPQNILYRYVRPAAREARLREPTWKTFRQTFSTLLHENATPGRTLADLMGHADVDTQFLYVQKTRDEGKRAAADKLGNELSRLVVQMDEPELPWVN